MADEPPIHPLGLGTVDHLLELARERLALLAGDVARYPEGNIDCLRHLSLNALDVLQGLADARNALETSSRSLAQCRDDLLANRHRTAIERSLN